MTIDFICEVIAELFDSPCNYSPIDEQMFADKYCESHCGKITDKECWEQYFEKRRADRKTEPSGYNLSPVEDEPQTEREGE